MKLYFEYLELFGYWKNPYEIEAEDFARKNVDRAFNECGWVLE